MIPKESNFLTQLRIENWLSLWSLHESTGLRLLLWRFHGCLELPYVLYDCLFDQPIVNHVFVMVSAPSPEEVDQWLAFKFWCKMLSKTLLKFFDAQEAIFVIIDVFDRAPYLGGAVWILSHNRGKIVFINLVQALQFVVLCLLNPLLLNCN